MNRRENPICCHCGTLLTDDNWYKSDRESYAYRCRSCHKKVRNQREGRKSRQLEVKPYFKQDPHHPICIHCKTPLTQDNWPEYFQKAHSYSCRACYASQNAERARRRRHQRGAKQRFKQNPPHPVCIHCKTPLTQDNWHPNDRDHHSYACYDCRTQKASEIGMTRYRRNKVAVIRKYGGSCACCSESRIEFLSLDHINGDGREDRANKRGNTFYRDLLKQPRRADLRVLCMNCNFAIGKYGYCPHERERNGQPGNFDYIIQKS